VSAEVVVAVATYNGRHLLETFLPSLAAQEFGDFRTVVVDDASADDTVEWLAREWPDVEVVALERNGGVTAAFNHCLRAAAGAEFVALFNNDMELDPRCIGELVRDLREHPGAGSATAKLLDFHDRDVLDGAGDLFRWAGTGWRRGHGEPDRGQYERPGPIFGACGGAALYRRAAIEAVGGFDESFFAFMEDTDWALRAQLAGWPCRYVPTAVAYHMGSATLGKGLTDFTRYQLWRNAIWMIAKDYPAGALVRHAHQLLYVQAAQLALSARDRKLGVWWRAIRDAIRGLPAVLRRRRAVQRTRRVSVRELEAAVRAEP
jgi:GT2 family glycosyltransferase